MANIRNAATTAQTQAPPATTVPPIQVPKGYQEQTDDLVGFWNHENGPIHVIPRSMRMFDSSIDRTKSSTLLLCELVEPCQVEDKDGEPVLARAGQSVGIWYKPGLRPLLKQGGIASYVYRFPEGDIDTGKPNPMMAFKVLAKVKGQNLPLEGDYRAHSRPKDAAPTRAAKPVSTEDGNSEAPNDDIPF